MKNILISSAGRRVKLLLAFKEQISARGLDSQVFTTDQNPGMSAACCLADKAFQSPHCLSAEYKDWLTNLVADEHIGVIIPTIDTELPILSSVKNQLQQLGCQVVISNESFLKGTENKADTISLFEKIGIQSPKVFSSEPDVYPVISKPIVGSASVGVIVHHQSNDTLACRLKNPDSFLVSELLEHPYVEYTLDCYFDINHRLLCMVPRQRLETREGEISKGRTIKPGNYATLFEQVASLKGARGPITVQVFITPTDEIRGIEINPRFGGGFPLSYSSGAPYPGWIVDEYLLGKEMGSPYHDWENNQTYLRFDDHVLV